MGDPFPIISTGSGGVGAQGGIGGRGGDVHLHSHNYRMGPSELLMSLPRANYARHDSGREDAPSACLEGTRVAILKEIISWSESANGTKPPVYWLSGLAGIGKSTIANTVAQRADEKAMLGASFFFSRSDKPLRDPQLVFSTLAFQLAQSDGAFKNVIVEALKQDPTVGHKQLLPQLQELILTPLLKINLRRHPTLIILDALDECEEKGAADILRLVFSHVIRIPFLRILITSRPQPHLSSVFNKAANLAKTVLHDIEASVIQQDIRFYISTELAKIPEKLDLSMPTDWATETQRDLLVEHSGKLFVYAATAIRFIGDDRVRDPPRHLSLILNGRPAQETGARLYSQLDNLYMGVLRNSLSPSNHRETLRRFQIVVGSIVLLREPLPLYSLAQFVEYERHTVEATLYHLHSVIVPPSNVREAPRIYHPSFLEFITDASRCSMVEFVIVPVPEQELRHAIRCFELMARYLKRDVAGISDPSLLNTEVYGFEQKVRDALPLAVQYACRYWASHLSRVELGEEQVVEALEAFSMGSILWWFEAMSLIGSVPTAASSIQEAHRWAISSKCKAIPVKILSDAYRFIFAHGEVIRRSALHVYHSALPFTPHDSALYKAYWEDGKDCIRVLQGVESEWPRNLSTLVGHSAAVATAAFSPDGLHLASGSYDHTVRVWDAISGASMVKLEGHSGVVMTVTFSLDGLHLATGSKDCTLRVWDAMSGAPIHILGGHSDWVMMVAFLPDGFSLASHSRDSTLCLWDVRSGLPIAKLQAHYASPQSVAFSPDGLCLASISDDDTIHLLDARSGVLIAKLEGHSDLPTTLAFSSDGLHLVSGSKDHTLWLWDAMSHVPITQLEGHAKSISTVAFSPNGLCLASTSTDDTLQLWDAMSGTPIGKPKRHDMNVIAFSPDGLCLVSSGGCGDIELWDAMSGATIGTLEGHSEQVTTIVFSPDGSCLASGSYDGALRLWDVMPGTPIIQQEGPSGPVATVVFSPNGLHLASVSDGSTLQLWDAISGVLIARMEGHCANGCDVLAFSPDGSCLASGSRDYTLRLWDVMSGAPIAKLEGHSLWICSIAFSPDGLSLASGSADNTLCLWDVMSGVLIAKLECYCHQLIVFSPDGSHLASGSSKGLCLWDVMSRVPIAILEGSSRRVTAIAFSPDGLHLASGTQNYIQLWDAMSGALINKLEHHWNSSWFRTIAFSPDGCTLIAHGESQAFPWYWDLTSHPPQHLFSGGLAGPPGHPVGLTPLIWSFHDRWIRVEHCKEHLIRRICYIPPQISCTSDFMVSSQQTHTRIAVGCIDGRVLIIVVPHVPFNWCLNEEWSYTGLVYHDWNNDPSFILT